MANSIAAAEVVHVGQQADARLAEYRQQGYTVFEGVYDEGRMQLWREECLRLEASSPGIHAPGNRSWWFGNVLERSPALMWPAVSNPLLLDFAERVVGPFVQLDNLTLAAFPSVSKEEAAGKVSGWHRDRWAHMPSGHYERPTAWNTICYLQDLTDEYGPLRVIPGSHIDPVAIDEHEQTRPHPDEVVLYPKAGDVVFTHNGLLHSGTPNTSGQRRYFFSIYYNTSWFKQTDTMGGPNCQQLIRWACKRNDYRSLRLLGVDEQLQPRANSGFLQPDEVRWEGWLEADKGALKVSEEGEG